MMNPRIKELAKQARQIGEYVNYGQIRLSPEQFEQKFAELIVKECMTKVEYQKTKWLPGDRMDWADEDFEFERAIDRSIAALQELNDERTN